MSWAAVFPVAMFLSNMSRSSLCDSCETFFPSVSIGAVAFGQAKARRTCEAVLLAPNAAARTGSVHPACNAGHNHTAHADSSVRARLSINSVHFGMVCQDEVH